MELEEKARQKARCYDRKYSEDFTMADMLSRPQDFNKQSIKDVYLCLKEKHYRDGYIDGVAEGKPEWHDLRKDPNDLPKHSGLYCVQCGEVREYVKEEKSWFTVHFEPCMNCTEETYLWCELPKFEEE